MLLWASESFPTYRHTSSPVLSNKVYYEAHANQFNSIKYCKRRHPAKLSICNNLFLLQIHKHKCQINQINCSRQLIRKIFDFLVDWAYGKAQMLRVWEPAKGFDWLYTKRSYKCKWNIICSKGRKGWVHTKVLVGCCKRIKGSFPNLTITLCCQCCNRWQVFHQPTNLHDKSKHLL